MLSLSLGNHAALFPGVPLHCQHLCYAALLSVFAGIQLNCNNSRLSRIPQRLEQRITLLITPRLYCGEARLGSLFYLDSGVDAASCSDHFYHQARRVG